MTYAQIDRTIHTGNAALQSQRSANTAARPRSKGFTLIELLVVIALTLTLLALLFGPLIAGFQYTSRAQTISAAQSGQRLFMQGILRDLQSAAGIRDTQGKFLNVMILQKASPSDSTGTQVLAHLYNGYTDVVPPMPDCQDPSTFTKNGNDVDCHGTESMVLDPTTHTYTVLQTGQATHGAAYGQNPGIVTPLAPGTGITRYFVGLRYPINLNFNPSTPEKNNEPQPYNNVYDNEREGNASDPWISQTTADFSASYVAAQQLDNTYIVYVANIQPYIYNATTKSYSVDPHLFQSDANGKPILDDPDFFRIVTAKDLVPTTDPTYTSSGTVTYGAANADAHNERVYYWYKAARPQITGRDYDVMAFARSGGNVSFGDETAKANPFGGNYGFLPAASDTGGPPVVTFDTTNLVSGGNVPEVRSTFNFGAAGAQNEPMQPQSTAYVSQGQDTIDPTTQQPYLPTVYKTSEGQIQGSPTFTIIGDGATYTAQLAGAANDAVTLADTSTVAATDMVEFSGTTLVYDATQGSAASGQTTYIPVTFNPTLGTLSFATSAMPPVASGSMTISDNADPTNSHNPWWTIQLTTGSSSLTDTSSSGATLGPYGDEEFDITNATEFADNPFTGTTKITPMPVFVPNTERVMGPDQNAGPAGAIVTGASVTAPIQYNLIPYTRVMSLDDVGKNEYYISYQLNTTGNVYEPIFHLGPTSNWTTILSANDVTRKTILVSYNIQNNYSYPSGSTTTITPAQVTATYASANSLKVTVGFRVYDPNSKESTFISSSNTASLGNGLR